MSETTWTCPICLGTYDITFIGQHNEMMHPNLGRKTDQDKLRWSLLPYGTIVQVLGVLEFGAKKYSVGNWAHVPDARTRYYDAAMRHLEAWWLGQEKDPESGLPHLAHAVCCLLFLMWFDVQVAARGKSLSNAEWFEQQERRNVIVKALNGTDLPKDVIGEIMEKLDRA